MRRLTALIPNYNTDALRSDFPTMEAHQAAAPFLPLWGFQMLASQLNLHGLELGFPFALTLSRSF